MARRQVGGFGSQGDALQGLQVALERLRRRKRLAQITLSELAEEYLAQHEAEPRTIAKLRWLRAKATFEFGDWPVVEARRTEGEKSSKALGEPWPLEVWPDVPTRYLLCRDDRMFSAVWARRHARERFGIEAGLLVALPVRR